MFRILKFSIAECLLAISSVLMLVACGGGGSSSGTPAPTTPTPAPVPASSTNASNPGAADVLIYGATPAGISAALEAAKAGKHVLVLEPTKHVGGMITSGVSVTDAYPQDRLWAMGGFARRFVDAVNLRYDKTWTMGGIFHEPHVAESILLKMIADVPAVIVKYDARLESVQSADHSIKGIQMQDGSQYIAKIFIDASYEGDLMAKAGINHTQGREAKSQYNEALAGVGPIVITDGAHVDPYVVPGRPDSGLLPHVAPNNLGAAGAADSAVQAYGYRICVTADKANQIPVVKPDNYDPREFELLGRIAKAHPEITKTFHYIANVPIPNNKFDVNSLGLLSTDEIEGSAEYIRADANGRRAIEAEHKRYTMALLTFLATDPRIPPNVQADVRSWGFCKDEFQDNGGFPRLLYVREGRRMIGDYVMTQHDLYNETTIPDSIGLGAFPIDQHVVHRVAVNGQVGTEGAIWQPLARPYPISYRSITPKYDEMRNLLVPVALSASHVAFSSLRVEPTYMITGQAAGAAAAIAINSGNSVQRIDYAVLAAQLKASGAVLNNR